MDKFNKIIPYTTSGLNKMTGTVMILIGTGAISGILMTGATASTATESIVVAGSFGQAILTMGIAPLNAAVMVHTGATVIDHLPHGNFFHASADAVKMDIKERMKLIPFESMAGGAMCIVATIVYGFLM